MPFCSHCGAEIRWITMEDTGKKLAIDIAPDDAHGTVLITAGDKGKVLTRAELVHYAACGRRFYTTHFPSRCKAASAPAKLPENVVRFPRK